MRWPKLPWDRLEAWGISLQVVKTAMAAGLAWALAGAIFHTQKPYFAPLAAILSVQATIAESLSRGVQRIAGVVAGIVLAIFFTHWLGLDAWSLALLVFVGMAAATRLKLGPQGIPQVAISALMVMAVGSVVHRYAWYRLFETALGAVVAVMVSALVWPPDLTPEASQSVRLLAVGVSALLEQMRGDLIEGLKPEEANRHLARARVIGGGLERARRGLNRARTSVRWNPWHRDTKTRLDRLGQAVTVLDHVLMQIRGVSRTLFVTLDRDVAQKSAELPSALALRLARTLSLMGEAVRCYGNLVEGGNPREALRLERALAAAETERQGLLQDAAQELAGDMARFIDVAAVVVDLDKMSQDLKVSSGLIIPIVSVRG